MTLHTIFLSWMADHHGFYHFPPFFISVRSKGLQRPPTASKEASPLCDLWKCGLSRCATLHSHSHDPPSRGQYCFVKGQKYPRPHHAMESRMGYQSEQFTIAVFRVFSQLLVNMYSTGLAP